MRKTLLTLMFAGSACLALAHAGFAYAGVPQGMGTQDTVAAPPAPDPMAQVLPLDPHVRYGKLENGLTYYIRQNAKPENRVMLQLAVNAGSICETEEQRGLAHFTEHMLFNGTKNFPKNELVDFLQKTGVRFGGDINAYTSFDETVYMLEIPTDKEGMLESGFQVLEDWAHQASMETQAIEDERGVIIEEWRMGLGAQDRMRKKIFPVIFGNSLYAERLPIGTIENLKAFKPEYIRQFYKDFYRPDLQSVIVVGNIDPDYAEQMVEKHFGKLRNPANEKARRYVQIPDNAEPIFTVATDKEATSSLIEIYIKHPSKAMKTLGDYREHLLSILGSYMFNSRLGELTQNPACPAVVINMGEGNLVRKTDILAVSAMAKPGQIDESFMLMLQEIARVDQHGFVPTELERAKQAVLSLVQNQLNEAENQLSTDLAKSYVNHFLLGDAEPGIEIESSLVQALVPGITAEEVSRYIQERITDSNMIVIVNAPEKEGLPVPSEAELASIYASSRGMEAEPYVDRVSMEPLLEIAAKPASGAKVVSEDTAMGVTEVRLSNGISVTLMPTALQNDEILMLAYAPGGMSTVEDGDYLSAMFAGMIQGESGLGQFDKTELDKQLTGKNVNYSLNMGDLTVQANGTSSVKDFETMLQLNYLSMTQPRKDGRATESFVSRMKAQMRFLVNNPMVFFMDTLAKVSSNHDPRVIVIPTEEQLNSVDSNKVYEFYCSQVADPGAFRYYLVGNFEIDDDFLSLLETYIGSLPSKGSEPAWVDRSVPMSKKTVDIKVEKGSDEQGMAGIVFRAPVKWNLQEREALSYFKDIMEIKMLETIREKMGGVYSPMIDLSVSHYPDAEVEFAVMFGCDPDRADSLSMAVFAEMERIMKEGPLPGDVAKVQELHKRNFENSVQKNSFWLSVLQNADWDGTPLSLYTGEAQSGLAESMTPDLIRKVVKKYFGKMVYTRVVLGPDPAEME